MQAAVSMINGVMSYIREHHPDAAQYITQDTAWTRDSSVKKTGYTRAVYRNNGWVVSIGHTITLEDIYEISAGNAAAGIAWTGTIQDGVITETSYQKR